MNISFNTRPEVTQINTAAAKQRGKTGQNTKTAARTEDTITISSRATQESEGAKSVEETEKVSENGGLPWDPVFSRELLRLAEHVKTAKGYYEKQNEENKKFSNPQEHIRRKYFDRNYEHYVGGLTSEERETLYRNETDVLEGREPHIDAYDPALLFTYGEFGFGDPFEDNLGGRGDMNSAINEIFRKNGIEIPEGADLRLTVDPYDFKIRASGVDEELARKIEEALNKEGNGRSLYDHISASNPAHYGMPEPSQYREGDAWKMSVFYIVKGATGYDLRDLERKDGKFLTPDGEDVWDLVDPKYKDAEGINYAVYRNLAKIGWDTGQDSNLTIGYKDGSLYDIDTEYGYGPGQTGWIDGKREQNRALQAQYMAKREETIRREDALPNKYERLLLDMGADIPEKNGLGANWNIDPEFGSVPGLILTDGTFSPMRFPSEEVLKRLNAAFQAGEGALTTEVLRLPHVKEPVRRGIHYKV